jgi:hypothetical protein
MHLQYHYVQNAETKDGVILDCFAARTDSSGLRAFLYYLGSPYVEPFTNSGDPTESTHMLVERIKRDVGWLVNDMSDQHQLAPRKFLHDKKDRFRRSSAKKYGYITIYAFVGRRSHYERNESNNARLALAKSIEKCLAQPIGKSEKQLDKKNLPNQYIESYQTFRVEFISYDRVLESVQIEQLNKAGSYRRYLRK